MKFLRQTKRCHRSSIAVGYTDGVRLMPGGAISCLPEQTCRLIRRYNFVRLLLLLLVLYSFDINMCVKHSQERGTSSYFFLLEKLLNFPTMSIFLGVVKFCSKIWKKFLVLLHYKNFKCLEDYLKFSSNLCNVIV